ncbi:MAG TPA: hypothetical protein VJR89_02615 [Polyangiales bacterium]|nr:hypothetical protein [Polyangiales bacterium]
MPGEDERKAGKPGSEPAPDAGSIPPPNPTREAREPRSPLDLVPEILRRGLSAGRDVSESLFPRELASNLASQLVDARHGLVTAIATEVGRFLRQADIASEMRKVLAGLNIEAKIQLRFSEDESGKLKPQVEVEREQKGSGRKSSKPPPASDSGAE